MSLSAVPPSPNPLKRAFDEADSTSPVMNSIETTSEQPASFQTPYIPSAADSSSIKLSPAPSSALSSITATPEPGNLDGAVESKPSAPKRRKLTPAEKLQREAEKHQKEAEKEEKRKKREEEKAVREAKKAEDDEIKRQRAEVKEEKRREKELEKLKKDEEKRVKEEAIAKKEAAQSRMSTFFKPFGKPASPATVAASSPRKNTTSIEGEAASPGQTSSDAPASTAKPLTDYERTFLPYCLPSYASCAPINRFTWDTESHKHMEAEVGHALKFDGDKPQGSLRELIRSNCASSLRRRGYRPSPVRHIIARLSGTADDSIDVSGSQHHRPLDALKSVPMKCILFREDVRPPYIGTHTSLRDVKGHQKLARKPTVRQREELDYDYDSEAEWEEPEEGEEVLSEADLSDEGEDDEDMEDFLDDVEAENSVKKRLLAVDTEPVTSGLVWADADGDTAIDAAVGYSLRDCRMEVLLEDVSFPIDPLSASYWVVQGAQAAVDTNTSNSSMAAMQPPRVPLQPRPNLAVNSLAALHDGPKDKGKKAAKESGPILQGSDLQEFKRVVQGNQMDKVGVLSQLKVTLPNVTRTVLKDTLQAVAKREGKSQKDKRWIILEEDAGIPV